MEIEWNEIRARTIMDRWDFSWDVTQGLIKKSMVAVIPVDRPEDSAAERGKAVKLAKGGAFQLQISLFQRFRNTPVFIRQLLPFSSASSHYPYRKHCVDVKIPINSLYFRGNVQRCY